MSKKEVNTDIWVASMLKENEIKYDAQGSTVKELDEALKTEVQDMLGILNT